MGEDFWNGTLPLHQLNVDRYTLEVLKELQNKDDDPPKINANIIKSDIKANYKNWKNKPAHLLKEDTSDCTKHGSTCRRQKMINTKGS